MENYFLVFSVRASMEGNTLFIDLMSKPYIEIQPGHDVDKPNMQEYPPKSVEVSFNLPSSILTMFYRNHKTLNTIL